MRASGSCVPNMACRASTSPLDFGVGCFWSAHNMGSVMASASVEIVKTRCMKKTPSILFLKRFLHPLLGRAPRSRGSAIKSQGGLIVFGSVVAIPGDIGKAAHIDVRPGLHPRIGRRIEHLLEKPFAHLRVVLQHRDPR